MEVKSFLATVMVVLMGVFIIAGSCGACGAAPPPAAEADLGEAVRAAHVAAADKLQVLAERIESEAGGDVLAFKGTAPAATLEALWRYIRAVREGRWQEGAVPLLRDAARAYKKLQLLYPALPALPRIVDDLLAPCEEGSAAESS